MVAMDDAPLWEPDSSRPNTFVPTAFTRGPWDPGLLHGGPVAALLAELMYDAADRGMQPVRLTVDLMRPVPMVPLVADVRVVRTGKRLQLLEGGLALASDGRGVARSSLLFLRPAPFDASDYNAQLAPPPDSPEDDVDESWRPPIHAESFVGGAMDFRFGRQLALGHGVGWLRLHRRVLADRPISPLARAAAAADVGNAVSARRDPALPRVTFVNADLSLSLARPPEGEWIRLESRGRWESSGLGWVSSSMSDMRGELGAVSNGLVLEQTGGSPPVGSRF